MYWGPDLEVGLPLIDQQHWCMFSLILRIHQCDGRLDFDDVRATVDQLARLAQYHFDCEQWLMSQYEYPDAANHRIEHESLAIEVTGYRRNTVFRPQQLALVLSNWLVSHTLMADRPLVSYVKESTGGTPPPIPESLANAFWQCAECSPPFDPGDRTSQSSISGTRVIPQSVRDSRDKPANGHVSKPKQSNRRLSRR